jgi:hypothetical protein
MGLTIHYTLQSATPDTSEARRLVEQLQCRTKQLMFDRASDVIELNGKACNYDRYDKSDERKWLTLKGRHLVHWKDQYHVIPPVHLIAFEAQPGDGCEWASFGLCRYPETFKAPKPDGGLETAATDVPGWQLRSFCKTQYASNPAHGGLENFLRCHQAVIGVLDHARELGILESVSDESRYWEHRDPDLLTKDVTKWNQSIAAFYGKFKDHVPGPSHSPIGEYPNFEHLEAEGNEALGDDDDS